MMKNPNEQTPAQFWQTIETGVKGARTSKQVETRLRSLFFPEPHIWVQEWGKNCFGILAQQYRGGHNASRIFER